MTDVFIDYKREALKAFVGILEANKDGQSEGNQSMSEDRVKNTTFNQISQIIGDSRLDNILATFSLEYAESRGNLNKEQAFFYLALYQYAMSRQDLLGFYLKATTEKHPDVQRRRQCNSIEQGFSQFTTPILP